MTPDLFTATWDRLRREHRRARGSNRLATFRRLRAWAAFMLREAA